MVCNSFFNNISVISWRSVWLLEETGVPREIHRPAQITDKLYHLMLYQVHLAWAGFELTTLMVKDTDRPDSCKSIYHTIKTTTTPLHMLIPGLYCIMHDVLSIFTNKMFIYFCFSHQIKYILHTLFNNFIFSEHHRYYYKNIIFYDVIVYSWLYVPCLRTC